MCITEYRNVNEDNRAHRTVHREAYSPKLRRSMRLVESTAGYEPAGSMMRWTEGYWAVWWELDNARHGRRFKTQQEAEALFASLQDS